MKIAQQIIEIRKQTFVLTNQRALFWKNKNALVLSDLHLGKSAHFRKFGIALPSQIMIDDLNRLSNLILHYNTEQLLIVGDFIHAGRNSEFELFKQWRLKFKNVKIVLIKGNHDSILESHFIEIGISEIFQTYEDGEIVLRHQHIENSESFIISGHLHPGITIKSTTKTNIKYPCYVVSDSHICLPAFSSFTGLDTHDYFPKSRKYIFDKDSIFLV